MAYTPLTWTASTETASMTTPCTSNLNHFEEQYAQAYAYSTANYAGTLSPTFTGAIYFGTWSVGECSTTKVANTIFVRRRVLKVKSDYEITGMWTTA